MRKLKLIDRLRGWHWRNGVKVRNWCGCTDLNRGLHRG